MRLLPILLIRTFLLGGVFVMAQTFAWGCECKPRTELGVSDWNSIPFIFKARLEKYQKTFQFGALTFTIIEQFKGELSTDSMTIYYQPNKSHTLLHAVKDFSAGKEWIVFAQLERVGQRQFYRLVDTDNDNFCALSRPLKTETEPYLPFVEHMAETAYGLRQFYNDEGVLLAEGAYDQKIPVGHWQYFWNGKVYTAGNFKQGKKHGDWSAYVYDEQGRRSTIKKETYNEGVLLEINHYNLQGKLRWMVEIADDRKVFSYYRNNEMYSKRIGTLDGKLLYSASYNKGKLIREERFE